MSRDVCGLCGAVRGEPLDVGGFQHLPEHLRYRCPTTALLRRRPELSVDAAREIIRELDDALDELEALEEAEA
jgi:hypothetical protein